MFSQVLGVEASTFDFTNAANDSTLQSGRSHPPPTSISSLRHDMLKKACRSNRDLCSQTHRPCQVSPAKPSQAIPCHTVPCHTRKGKERTNATLHLSDHSGTIPTFSSLLLSSLSHPIHSLLLSHICPTNNLSNSFHHREDANNNSSTKNIRNHTQTQTQQQQKKGTGQTSTLAQFAMYTNEWSSWLVTMQRERERERGENLVSCTTTFMASVAPV